MICVRGFFSCQQPAGVMCLLVSLTVFLRHNSQIWGINSLKHNRKQRRHHFTPDRAAHLLNMARQPWRFGGLLSPVSHLSSSREDRKERKNARNNPNANCYYCYLGHFSRVWSKAAVFHSYNHTPMAVAAMQGADHGSRAVWGSISRPRTLWHADQGNRTSDLPITRCWLYPLFWWDTLVIACSGRTVFIFSWFYFQSLLARKQTRGSTGTFLKVINKADSKVASSSLRKYILKGAVLSWGTRDTFLFLVSSPHPGQE